MMRLILIATLATCVGCNSVKGMICDAPPAAVECAVKEGPASTPAEGESASEEPGSGIGTKVRAKRLELERREAALEKREAELAARDTQRSKSGPKGVNPQVAAAQKRDAGVQRLTELVSEMKTKTAVSFLGALPDAQASQVLLRLDKSSAAAILAALPPQRAARLAQGGVSNASH